MESIAIDGPAGVGKSTIAAELAKKLGMELFDSGSIYRAVAVATDMAKIPSYDEEALAAHLKKIKITVEHIYGAQHTYLNGKDITMLLKKSGVGERTSEIAEHAKVRRGINKIFERIGIKKGYVIEGRDIGTYMLPKAKVKFYMTASVEVRAQRRYEQYKEGDKEVNLKELMEDIETRDYRDMTRKVAPLKKAKDAIVIDSSYMSIEETLKEMLMAVEERIKK